MNSNQYHKVKQTLLISPPHFNSATHPRVLLLLLDTDSVLAQSIIKNTLTTIAFHLIIDSSTLKLLLAGKKNRSRLLFSCLLLDKNQVVLLPVCVDYCINTEKKDRKRSSCEIDSDTMSGVSLHGENDLLNKHSFIR